MEWKITDTRFVAFLDIMGFREFVARNTHTDVYDTMKKVSSLIKRASNYTSDGSETEINSYLHLTIFSDSLIIFSIDDSIKSFKLVTSTVCYIVSECIKEGIPLKGSIAHGSISLDIDEQIFFGQPLIDSYLLQDEVHYYGVVMHCSVDKYVAMNRKELTDTINDVLIDVKTPLKSGYVNHLNLNWFNYFHQIGDEFQATSNKILKSLNDFRQSTSGGTRKYIDNTLDLFKSAGSNRYSA